MPTYSRNTLKQLSTLDRNPVDAHIFLFYYTERINENQSLHKLADPVGSKKHLDFLKKVIAPGDEEVVSTFKEMSPAAFRERAKVMDMLAQDCIKMKVRGVINPYVYLPQDITLFNPANKAFGNELIKRNDTHMRLLQQVNPLENLPELFEGENSMGASNRKIPFQSRNTHLQGNILQEKEKVKEAMKEKISLKIGPNNFNVISNKPLQGRKLATFYYC